MKKSFCKYAAISSSSYLYSEYWNSFKAKQDVSRGSLITFFFKRKMVGAQLFDLLCKD